MKKLLIYQEIQKRSLLIADCNSEALRGTFGKQWKFMGFQYFASSTVLKTVACL